MSQLQAKKIVRKSVSVSDKERPLKLYSDIPDRPPFTWQGLKNNIFNGVPMVVTGIQFALPRVRTAVSIDTPSSDSTNSLFT